MEEQNFQTQELQCVECGAVFEFSAEDQEFYAKKGFSAPKRCPQCRARRKAQQNNRGGYRERRY
jgi:NAD-dependent SIR2 family protein deacetylase